MKRLLFISILLVVFISGIAYAQNQTIYLALNADNSGTTTQIGGGVSTFVINSAPREVRLELATGPRGAAVFDANILTGNLRLEDGFYSICIEEWDATDAYKALGNYSGATCTITRESVNINDAAHWANPNTLTLYSGVALSGNTPISVRYYPVWGDNFERYKFTTGGSTQFQKAKVKIEKR